MQNRTGRRTGISLGIALYLFSLSAPLAHAAAFSDDPHDHGGQPCQVQQLQETAGHGLVAPIAAIDVMTISAAGPAPVVESFAGSTAAAPYASRAPPA